MKYVLTFTGLLLLSACGNPVDDYCHTQNPASDVELKDRLCDRPNDGGKGIYQRHVSDRVVADVPTSNDRPVPSGPEVNKPDTPTDPDEPDLPTDPDDDGPKGNNGHGNGNDDGTCQGRGCTDDTNPGKGPKNQ